MWTCRFSDKQRTIKFYNWHVKQEAFYKVVPIERSGVILIWGAAWSLLCLLTSPYTSLPSVTAQAGPGEIPRLQSSISLCSRGGPVVRVTSMARPRSGTRGPDMTSGLLGHVRLSPESVLLAFKESWGNVNFPLFTAPVSARRPPRDPASGPVLTLLKSHILLLGT